MAKQEIVSVPPQSEPTPLSKNELMAQVKLIQEVMKGVMQNGQHYGTIPGCGDKPALLKPGAEKLLMTFRLAAACKVEPLHTEGSEFVGFRVHCPITSIHSGKLIGEGVGECSTREDKYQWRKAVCQEEFDETDPNDRRKKFVRRRAGFGHEAILQVKTNPYDLANTILKMAKKRALVDGTLTTTAASDIFTQDEDIEDQVASQKKTATTPASQPQAKRIPTAPKCGEYAGKPLTEVPDDWLRQYLDMTQADLEDPKKEKHKKSILSMQADLVEEIDRRILAENQADSSGGQS